MVAEGKDSERDLTNEEMRRRAGLVPLPRQKTRTLDIVMPTRNARNALANALRLYIDRTRPSVGIVKDDPAEESAESSEARVLRET